MLTTEGHLLLVQRAKKCGVKGWMVKPFSPELLVAAVRRITGAASEGQPATAKVRNIGSDHGR